MKLITINPNSKPYYSEDFIKGFKCGAERQFETDKADRPQGEWIRTGRTNIYGGIEVQCSHCKDKVMVQHLEDEWYCRHCGADMRKDGAE